MELAKDRLDVALVSDRIEVSAFYRGQAGVELEEVLPLQSGWDQHRHTLAGSVLKVNIRTDRELQGRSAIAEILAVREGLDEPRGYIDPDGTVLTRVPPGHVGIEQILVRLAVPDPERTLAFWTDTFGFERADEHTARCGLTLIRPEEGPAADRVGIGTSRGWNYLTVQVQDCDAEHAAVLARGGEEVVGPRTLGDVARFSFVCDPDGTLLEISERRSLTGRPLRRDPRPPTRL
ncbi:MAG TPA: VOC family protein [Solirubrobacteraceae bacterium]|jgi:catechol 2,3-dioxygenase-like lactoylglutathione lyase family enzyme|nr:VOC family protein [Solirubrobacteraceae bacterium]